MVLILFNVSSFSSFIFMNIYALLFIISSREKKLYKITIPFIPMFFVMVILNSITISTGTYLTSFMFIDIYSDAIKTTIIFFDRIIVISLLTFTTVKSMSNSEIVFGFKGIFKPLKIIKFPVDIAALICSITLNFFPIVLEEIKRIRKAQVQRGINHNANIIKRSINMKAVIIPTFTYSFAKAINIGNALEIKGYNYTNKRSNYMEPKLEKFDYLVYLILAILFVL